MAIGTICSWLLLNKFRIELVDMDQFITSFTRIKYNPSLRKKVKGCLTAVFQHGVHRTVKARANCADSNFFVFQLFLIKNSITYLTVWTKAID